MVAGLLVEWILSFIGVLRWGVRAAGGGRGGLWVLGAGHGAGYYARYGRRWTPAGVAAGGP